MNYELTQPDVAGIANGRLIDGDTGFRSDQVRYSRMVAAAIRSKSRMIGNNEGGVLPAGCEYAFRGLEKNQEQFLRLASCFVMVRRTGIAAQDLAQPLPRIWFCPRGLEAMLETPVDSLSKEQVDQLAEVACKTQVTIIEDGTQRIQIKLHTDSPGSLIVAETWYPEWTATVNGMKCNIQKAFGCFRGIPVTTESHSVTIAYELREFRHGRWVTFAAVFVICIGLLRRIA